MPNNSLKEWQILPRVVKVPDGADLELPTCPSGAILALFPDSDETDPGKAYLKQVFQAAGKHEGLNLVLWPVSEDASISWPRLLKHLDFSDLYLFGIDPSMIGLQSDLPMGVAVRLEGHLIFRAERPMKLQKNNQLRAALWALFQSRYDVQSPQ